MEKKLASDDANSPVESENLRASVALVAKTGGQFQLGDFEIDDSGRLRPRPDGAPISFGFTYRGIDFMAKVDTGSAPLVSLDAELGKLPYRAKIGARRELTRKIVRASQALPRGGIDLSDEHDMHLTAQIEPSAPLTPKSVLLALAAILLDFKPYLDLLQEVMLAPQIVETVAPSPDAAAT
jgi:hypothetical protein